MNTIRMVSTNGLRLFLQFWYAKRALYYIPKGWAPYYAEWILSFPKAPIGSVSIQIWGIACASVIALVSEALVAVFVLAMGQLAESKRSAGKPKTEAKVEMKAN
jgi:hypothetical protein